MSVDYLLIGHITADITPQGRMLGGTVSYATPVAHGFGYRVGILTSAAPCETLLETLLPFAQVVSLTSRETTTFENLYDLDGTRTQYLHDCATPLSEALIPQGWLNAPLVHLAPIAAEFDPALARLFPNALVLLTPQGMMRQWDEKGLVRFKRWFDADALRHVDLVVLSKWDIVEAPQLEQAFAEVVPHVFITDGDQGGIYYHRGTAERYAPFPVQEINPTGAGDVFAAALLASLYRLGYDFERSMAVAARLAALSVTRTGIEHAVKIAEIQQALHDVGYVDS